MFLFDPSARNVLFTDPHRNTSAFCCPPLLRRLLVGILLERESEDSALGLEKVWGDQATGC